MKNEESLDSEMTILFPCFGSNRFSPLLAINDESNTEYAILGF